MPPSPLAAQLYAEIAHRGPIPFRDFMAAALYDSAHGYYASGRAAIGRGGDYFTNVSVGSLFGRLLARQFAEMWERLARPGVFTIVEQGAHGGDFACDALGGLREFAPECFAAAAYVIIEPSEALRAKQTERLAGFGPGHGVQWRSSLAQLEPFEGVHFSNELLDAFPIHLVRWTGTEWVERHVASEDGRFVFTDAAIHPAELRTQLALIPQPLPADYTAEVNLAALDWVTTLAPKLLRGWILLIDYGYPRAELYRPERTAGTLSAYRHHRRVADPLETPGEIDLTTHVDWTSLVERAEAAGLRVGGFTDQHRFMTGLSPLHFSDADAISPALATDLRAFKTLMHPNLLGQSFKVLSVEKAVPRREPSQPLAGFTFAADPRAALGLDAYQ